MKMRREKNIFGAAERNNITKMKNDDPSKRKQKISSDEE